MSKYCIHCMAAINDEAVCCPICGGIQNIEVSIHQLLPGSILNGRYFVGKALGEGGFGITYMGFDTVFQRKIAIKEYFPKSFVSRNNTASLQVYKNTSEEKQAYVNKGITRFLDEARILGTFHKNEGIVSVYDFFEENGTAYIVMEYLHGETLKAYIEKNGCIPAKNLIPLMIPVMKTLSEVHKHKLIHRDISPDNIMFVEGETNIKLLDFGAARDYSMADGVSMSVVLKPGYAPEEQYRRKGKQGPWTDVYALCATMYKCITGIRPDEAIDRMVKDEVKTPSELGIQMNPIIERVIMKGLSVYAEDRYSSIDEMLIAFNSSNTSYSNEKEHTMPVGNDIKEDRTVDAGKNIEEETDFNKLFGGAKPQGNRTYKKKKNKTGIAMAVIFAVVALFAVVKVNQNLRDEPTEIAADKKETYEALEIESNNISMTRGTYAVIKEDGSLWMWGANGFGQLGNGTKGAENSSAVPIKIKDDVAAVSLKGEPSAITKDGVLWMWGYNGQGQLGNGGINFDGEPNPMRVLDDVVSVSPVGVSGSAAVTKDGGLWMWGKGLPLGVGESLEPVQVLDNIIAISDDIVIKRDGSVWKLGSDPDNLEKMMDEAVKICTMVNTYAAVTKDGELWMWGKNLPGEKSYVDIPLMIMGNVKDVSLGASHGAVLKNDDSLWIWGKNDCGQVGNGTFKDCSDPQEIMKDVLQISLGNFCSGAVKKDGSIWVWGENAYGYLGTGSKQNCNVPTEIKVGE